MTHLTFEQLSDLADGREPRAESREHLLGCAECSEILRKVRDLVAVARALPRDIALPAEVWTALRSRVGRAPSVRQTPARRWWYGVAAAAAVLMVGTVVLLPRGAGKAKATKVVSPALPAAAAAVVGAASGLHLAVEQSYSATLAELRRTLDTQGATLSPATVRILERSLATIDTAIAEAREALANDPANQALVGILSSNYERKVELLQRATELSSSS